MSTFYEIKFSDIIFDILLIVIPIVIGFALVYLLFYMIRKQFKSNPDTEFVKNINKQVSKPKLIFNIFQIIISVLFVVLTVFFISTNNDNIKSYNDYKDGDYKVVEGFTKKYSAPIGRVESFYVDDVYFSYLPNNAFGYDIAGIDGGAINGNDIYVKIFYVIDSDGNNCIMKLEVE